jgi:hypothetical protein
MASHPIRAEEATHGRFEIVDHVVRLWLFFVISRRVTRSGWRVGWAERTELR